MDNRALENALSELDSLTADLLSESHNELFLHGLFATKKGMWSRVSELCADLPKIQNGLESIERQTGSELLATWLDFPHSDQRSQHSLVLFFLEEYYWSKTAFFNRDAIAKSIAKRPKKAKVVR